MKTLVRFVTLLLIFTLIGCQPTEKRIANKIEKLAKKYHTNIIYTNSPNKLENILQDQIEKYRYDTIPYNLNSLEINALIVMFNSDIKFENLALKKKVKDTKLYIYHPYNEEFTSYLDLILKRNPDIRFVISDLKQESLTFLKLDKYKNLSYRPISNYRSKAKARTLNLMLEIEKVILVIQQDTTWENIVKEFPELANHNLLELDSVILVYPLLSKYDNVSYVLKEKVQKLHPNVKNIYSNIRHWLIQNPELKSNFKLLNLPYQTKNTQKSLSYIINQVSSAKGCILILNKKEKVDRPYLDSLKQVLDHYNFKKFNTLNTSCYLSHYTSNNEIYKLLDKALQEVPTIEFISTNKVYLTKTLYPTEKKIVWLPRKIVNNQVNKLYDYRLNQIKRFVESGQRLVLLYTKEVSDTLFPTEKELDQLLAAKKIKTKNGILYYTKYNNDTLRSFIESIRDKELLIYSNKFYVLKNLFDYPKSSSLPYKVIPNQDLFNQQFESQIKKVRYNLLLDSAVVVYFKDPYDKHNMSEQDVLNNFRHFKIENYSDFLIITSYNEQNE